MKILFLHRQGFEGTGGATYATQLIKTLSAKHETVVYKYPDDIEKNWDIVHSLNIKHLEVSALSLIKAPFIVDVHDAHWAAGEPFYPSPDWPLRWILAKSRRSKYKKILNRAGAVVVHSDYVARRIANEKCRVVPYAVEKIEPGPPLDKRAPNVLFAGRDFFRKGLPVLLDAWKHVCLNHPGARLFVAGREYAHGRTFAKVFARQKSITLLGDVPRNKLIELMRNVRAVVLPSWVESFGMVLIEAMAAGAVAIGSDTGGIREALCGGPGGILVKPGDSRALASAILRCLDDDPCLDNFVNEGLKIASEHSIETMTGAIENIYHEALQNSLISAL